MATFRLQAERLPDFVVLWAAHQTPNPYDMAALKQTIETVTGRDLSQQIWPYPYPPTFLLLSSWFSQFSYPTAFLAWAGLSGAAFGAASRHVAAPLLLLTPAVLPAVAIGQTSLLVGALIYGALTLAQRPIAAGVLLGIAACIKPQLGVLIPVGLVAAGQWRTIVAAGVTVLLAAAAATLAYGPESWAGWFSMMQRMTVFTTAVGGAHLDLPGWPLKLLALAIALPLTWRAFRRQDPAAQMMVACGSALLVTPHALWYNAAALAPAVLALLDRGWWRGLAGVGLMLLPPASAPIAGLVAVAAAPALRDLETARTWLHGLRRNQGGG